MSAPRRAVREADRAEAEALVHRMEGYGGPAQPSPTIGQCLNGGLAWLEVEYARCNTRARLPFVAVRRAGIRRSGNPKLPAVSRFASGRLVSVNPRFVY